MMPINERGIARESPLPRAPTPERKILIFQPEQSTTRGLVAQKFRQENSQLPKCFFPQIATGEESATGPRRRTVYHKSAPARRRLKVTIGATSLPRVTTNADIFRFSRRPHEWPRRSSVHETAPLAAIQAAELRDPRTN